MGEASGYIHRAESRSLRIGASTWRSFACRIDLDDLADHQRRLAETPFDLELGGIHADHSIAGSCEKHAIRDLNLSSACPGCRVDDL